MKKRVNLFWASVLLVMIIVCFPAVAGAAEIFDELRSPVLLKYVAEENKCVAAADADAKTVVISDRNGAVLKTYEELPFLNGQPVIDAGVIESDMGWTVCRHLPNTDMFYSEADAVAAGAFTYLNDSKSGEVTYLVGRCYFGWYFSGAKGEHEQKCSHPVGSYLLGEEFPIKIENGVLDYDFSKEEQPEPQGNVFAEAVGNSLSDKGLRPVLVEYILRKNGIPYDYSAEDKKINIYDKDGGVVTSFKDVTSLYGVLAMDSAALERAGIENVRHEPNTDLFDSEIDAITAGWLTYYRESENSEFKFYVGNCYGGCYFSEAPGSHAQNCDHSLNVSMFYEFPIVIVNGAIVFDDVVVRYTNSAEFEQFAQKSRKVVEDRPVEALTKMVTVMHTEYAKEEGVQSIYFSYRDRVYRDYWEDVANYDVTDYVFIPPALPRIDSYEQFSAEAALDLASSIKELLKHDTDAKIWIGTPGITSENYTFSGITPEIGIDFLKKVKSGLNSGAVWDKNIEGIYINQETIYPNEPQTQIDRIRKTVSDFKTKNPDKKSLWIPYYDLTAGSAEASEKIAELSRIPDLFDYIIIQPGYFFFERSDGAPDPETTSHRAQNIDAVKLSTEYNYVANVVGEPVIGESSKSEIGFQMETQASYFSNNSQTREESLDRYTQYLLAGAEIKEIGPVAFYASGDPHCNKEALIYKFYEAGNLSAGAVRKKLDYSLNKFYSYVAETRQKETVFYEYAKELYLSMYGQAAEDDFAKMYEAKAGLIIPEFYKYEKRLFIDDLAAHIEAGGAISDTLDESILKHFEPK